MSGRLLFLATAVTRCDQPREGRPKPVHGDAAYIRGNPNGGGIDARFDASIVGRRMDRIFGAADYSARLPNGSKLFGILFQDCISVAKHWAATGRYGVLLRM